MNPVHVQSQTFHCQQLLHVFIEPDIEGLIIGKLGLDLSQLQWIDVWGHNSGEGGKYCSATQF
jgi:hypothetical protein